VNLLNAICCLTVIGLTVAKRRRFRRMSQAAAGLMEAA